VILNFHGVGTPGRALEPGEAPYWIDADRFAAIVDLIRAAPAGRVGITFDDGNASDLAICAPLLARHGLGARIFVLAGRIGAQGSLSAADLRALVRMGFGIGSHGHDHLDWRGLDGPGEVRELVTARAAIAAACGRPVADVAVPFGRYDRGVLARLRRHGYERVYTSDGGAVGGRAGSWAAGGGFVVPRTSVRADMGLDEIRRILLGREPAARRLRRRAAMLRKRLF
jgi:peptidoglycan/xylan/chitin deacetylase (PgdA/CDA1 family)